jgi:hypothetical protein
LSAELSVDELVRGNTARFVHLVSVSPQILDCVSGQQQAFSFFYH